MNIGDFAHFRFIQRYNNGKVVKRFWEMYGTITAMDETTINILGNDKDEHIILKKDIEYFRREWPPEQLKSFINKLKHENENLCSRAL